MNFEGREVYSERVHQSCIDCAACPRRWFLSRKMGVCFRGNYVKESADLGTVFHKLTQLGDGHETEVRAWLRGKQQKIMDRVQRGEDVDGTLILRANMLTDLYNKALAMAKIVWERYPDPEWLQTIATELKWHCSTPYSFELEGTIDRVVLNKRDGTYWIRDYKSTGRELAAIFGGAGWGIQARIYRLLVHDWLSKHPGEHQDGLIKGFILDGIVKPTIKLCGKDEKEAKAKNITPAEAYLERVKAWYGEKITDTVKSKALFYCEDEYPLELVTALRQMDVYYRMPNDPKLYDRDITRRLCWQYERQCEFHRLCDTPVEQWDQLFEKVYTFKEKEDDDD